MLDIFTTDRVGTPITAQERVEIEKEIVKMRAALDPEALKIQALSLSNTTGFACDTSWVAVALGADIWGYEETLRTGVVAAW
jgi:hypothetical protein